MAGARRASSRRLLPALADDTGFPWFEVRRSRIQGRGAFALRRIPKGTRIIEYTGERISNAEADRRYDEDRMRRHHTFLFTLTQRTVVDGAVGGNASKYINHSCEPNCDTIIEGRQIFVEALRTIRKGEELTYDYRYESTGDPEEDAKLAKFYECHCGSKRCRGTILLPPKKRRRRPRRGKRHTRTRRARRTLKRRVRRRLARLLKGLGRLARR